MLLSQPAKLSAPHLDVMNFLNEIVLHYPAAISFAPGRPADLYCDIAPGLTALQQYIAIYEKTQMQSAASIRQQIGQYSKTNGIINHIIRSFLENDEGISVPEEAIMVTNGAQEGMAILAAGLFHPQQDYAGDCHLVVASFRAPIEENIRQRKKKDGKENKYIHIKFKMEIHLIG